MTALVVLVLGVAAAAASGRPLPAGRCPSMPDLGPLVPEEDVGERWRLTVEHPFMASAGISDLLAGLRYVVTLSSTAAFEAFVVESTQSEAPFGTFVSEDRWTVVCNGSANVAHSRRSYENASSRTLFWTTAELGRWDPVHFTAHVLYDGHWHWKSVVLHFQRDCLRYATSVDGSIRESDLSSETLNCSENLLVIPVPPDRRIFIQFQVVHLMYSKLSECSKEYVEVLGVPDDWTSHKFCGYLEEKKVARLRFASGREALVLRTKLVEGSAFEAVHYTLDRRKGCNDTVTLARGEISSPKFPSPYPPGVDCYVRIVVPERRRVVIRVRRLQLRTLPDGSCGSDFLELSLPSGGGRRFCGHLQTYSRQYATFFASKSVVVRFHSDWRGGPRGGGFLVDYATSVACGHTLYRDASNTLFRLDAIPASTSSPSPADWDDCFATVHVPHDRVIRVRVRVEGGSGSTTSSARFVPVTDDADATLNAPSGNCSDGFVELVDRDGPWVLCDASAAMDVGHVSSGNTLLVRVLRDRSEPRPSVTIDYAAVPADDARTPCDYGWVAGFDRCYLLVEEPSDWVQAEESCRHRGGYLAAVTDRHVQALLDAIVDTSLLGDEWSAVWIGGNDRSTENFYEWADGKPISYTNWFEGWSEFGRYNSQPSDDGLSDQDCVEMRRTFPYPAKGSGKTAGFYWNDRDCSVSNPYFCERLQTGTTAAPYPANCNGSVALTPVRSSEVVTSPSFPDPYPSDMDCTTVVTAPPGYKIVLTFSTFVLEDDPSCRYDYLEVFGDGNEPLRFCGDRTDRLKLLRRETSGRRLVLKFVSDPSHSYAGFVANVHLEGDRVCDDDWLFRFEDHCYLLVTFPTVTWEMANKICTGMQAHLTSVASAEEEAFLLEQISKSAAASAVFWSGGFRSSPSEAWTWTDSSPFVYSALDSETRGNRTAEGTGPASGAKPLCLALRGSVPTGNGRPNGQARWFGEDCERTETYICKKKSYANHPNLNRTLEGESGNVTSVGFPSPYPNNLHYTLAIVGPLHTRIVVAFDLLDLEWQEECLYDYVGLQSSELGPMTRRCGSDDRWEYVAEANVARLTFHSDFSETGGGFRASWKAVDVSGCPNRVATLTSGVLVSVNHPGPYLDSLDCETVVRSSPDGWIWLEFDSFVVGRGDSTTGDCPDDWVRVTWRSSEGTASPDGIRLCGNLTDDLPNLAFVAKASEMKVAFHSDVNDRFEGFRARYDTLTFPTMERVVTLAANAEGLLRGLNRPWSSPANVNFTRHLAAPVGYAIELRLEGLVFRWPEVNVSSTCDDWNVEVTDPYRSEGSSRAVLCPADDVSSAETLSIHSYFNVLVVRERTGNATNATGHFKMTYEVTKDPEFYNKTLMARRWIHSCRPSPCLNGGRCLDVVGGHVCKCRGHFIGLFCHSTECDSNPCEHGVCNLTEGGHECLCNRGYEGPRCETKQNPCAQNPCGSRGICIEENDRFVCRCHIWWQGPRCQSRAPRIPYKPLSQRMLEEPFWLGLITVFVVLTVLGLVWCIKRKFADKLEKFIAEEIEKSKQNPSCKANKRLSLRDQSSPVSLSPQSCPRSLFSRIGLRKHSMLSLDSGGSPNYHENRSFSFDDIVKKSDSQKRLDRRSPSPARFDKTELLHSLVAPPTSPKERRMSLDEFIQMSEKKILERQNSRENARDGESRSPDEETCFGNHGATTAAATMAANRLAFRKRVNFVRRLEKIDSVSFENDREEEGVGACRDRDAYLGVNGGPGDLSDAGSSCSSRISGSGDVPELMFSDSTNETEPAPRRTDVRRLQQLASHSDGSSAEVDSSWTSSEVLDPVCSEVQAEIHQAPREAAEERPPEEDRSRANRAPPKPPPPPVSKEGRCPDGCEDPPSKWSFGLEVAGDVPRPEAPTIEQQQHLLREENGPALPFPGAVFKPEAVVAAPSHPAAFRPLFATKPELASLGVPRVHESLLKAAHLRPGSPTVGLRLKPPGAEVCAYNAVERGPPSPYKKRLHEMEKTGSLDLPAPIITVTSNASSCESDTDSPSKTVVRAHHYLSPFDLIRQGTERSTSLSNLSSSGYSSMASPGPSRCNSNSPLFGADVDGDPGLSRPSPTPRKYGQHLCPSNVPFPVSPERPSALAVPKTGFPNGPAAHRVRPPLLRAPSMARKRSDSETTDEQPEPGSLPEDSNDDEGIGMDHIDFKIHRGEVTSAEDLELYMDGRGDTSPVDPPSDRPPGRELVCPAIVVQTLLQGEPDRDRCWKFVRRKSFQRKLSPVSSRSESPMSDRGCQNPGVGGGGGGDKSTPRRPPAAYTDSDELYDGPSSEVAGSPAEPRKQTRRRDKAHAKHRAKDASKRRVRPQNSVDADSSSSESSSSLGSPKDPLLLKEPRSHPYRKRILSRCESLQTRSPRAHSLGASEEIAVDGIARTSPRHAVAWDAAFADWPIPKRLHNGLDVLPEVTRYPARESTTPPAEESSHSELDFGDVSGRPDSDNSDFGEDSGSEVSFYLNGGRAARHKAEHRRLLSPARVSPDMVVICYGGGGFGRERSDDDDSGLV